MLNILDSLRSVNNYPIPLQTLKEIARGRGLDTDNDVEVSTLHSRDYKLAKADVLIWLSYAPNVSQGGQSYNFTDEQRAHFRRKADALYGECEEDTDMSKPIFGYKGNRL